MTICGSVVLDICQHFVERWNEIKRRKVRVELHYPATSLELSHLFLVS